MMKFGGCAKCVEECEQMLRNGKYTYSYIGSSFEECRRHNFDAVP